MFLQMESTASFLLTFSFLGWVGADYNSDLESKMVIKFYLQCSLQIKLRFANTLIHLSGYSRSDVQKQRQSCNRSAGI